MADDMSSSIVRLAETPLGKRERSKQEKRARIIQAAREVFAEKGFAAATTQEISQRAEIATGTLFLYAATKEELLLMTFANDVQDVARRAGAKLGGARPALEQLTGLFGDFSDYHVSTGPEISREVLKAILYTPWDHLEDVETSILAIDALIQRVIEQGKRSGELRARVPAAATANAILSLYHWQLTMWSIGKQSRPALDATLRGVLEVYLRGISRAR